MARSLFFNRIMKTVGCLVSFIRRAPRVSLPPLPPRSSPPPGYSLRAARLIADHLLSTLMYVSVFMFAPEARLITREAHNRSPPAPFTLAPSNISDACTRAAVAPDAPREPIRRWVEETIGVDRFYRYRTG